MLYKLYNEGFVNSLDDSVTDYENNFEVKNPFGSAPITLRWGFKFWVPRAFIQWKIQFKCMW